MSRGLGIIQRRALVVIQQADEVVLMEEVARTVYGRLPLEDSEAVALRRALRGLASKRLIVSMGRRWRRGQQAWALPGVAEEFRRKERLVLAKLR